MAQQQQVNDENMDNDGIMMTTVRFQDEPDDEEPQVSVEDEPE